MAVLTNIMIIAFAGVAAAFDIKTRRIPNKLVLCMLGARLLTISCYLFWDTQAALSGLLDAALGFLIGGGIFLAVYLINRDGLGGGDVKFAAAAGLFLGLGSIIPAIFIGTALAGIAGLALIFLKKITRKDKLPLAPFLLAGIMVTVLLQ